MRKNIFIIFVVSIPFVLFNCGLLDRIYQEPAGLGFIILFSEGRMLGFEKNVACYYNTYHKFPDSDSVLNNYSNTLKFSENDNLVFSSIGKDSTTNDNIIYNFQLHPWNASFKPDSLDSSMNSIVVYQFSGKLKFNDSLVTENMDSLNIELEVNTLCATLFIKDDSIHYNNIKYPNALIDQMKFAGSKISLSNSCSELDK